MALTLVALPILILLTICLYSSTITVAKTIVPLILYTATFAAAMGCSLFLATNNATTTTPIAATGVLYVVDDAITSVNTIPLTDGATTTITTSNGIAAATTSSGTVLTSVASNLSSSSPKTPKPARASGNVTTWTSATNTPNANRRLTMPYQRDGVSPVKVFVASAPSSPHPNRRGSGALTTVRVAPLPSHTNTDGVSGAVTTTTTRSSTGSPSAVVPLVINVAAPPSSSPSSR
jgi:hypothetical protein